MFSYIKSCTGWHIRTVKTCCWLIWDVRHHAWAVGSCSSGPPAARSARTKSTRGFLHPELSPCTISKFWNAHVGYLLHIKSAVMCECSELRISHRWLAASAATHVVFNLLERIGVLLRSIEWEVNIVACNVNMQCIIQGEIFYRARWPLKRFVELPYKCKRHLAFALTMIQETLEYAMSISRCVAYFEQILCPLYSHAFKEGTISQCGLLIMSEATTFPEHGMGIMGWLGTACVPYFNITVRWVP